MPTNTVNQLQAVQEYFGITDDAALQAEVAMMSNAEVEELAMLCAKELGVKTAAMGE